MEGKKFNSVTKVTTVNSNQSLLLTDQNGNVTSIGMDALKADLAVGQHAWCGRVWDTANATPKAASYIGSLELLKELPYILGLGAYLVKNDHSRRKLDSKDHYKYATGEAAKLDRFTGPLPVGMGQRVLLRHQGCRWPPLRDDRSQAYPWRVQLQDPYRLHLRLRLRHHRAQHRQTRQLHQHRL